MIDTRPCSNCDENILINHSAYRTKVKYKTVDGKAVSNLYCSDACLEGIPKGTLATCKCDMRKMVLTEGRQGKKYVCLSCMVVTAPLIEMEKERA